jgi:hypothetical protein
MISIAVLLLLCANAGSANQNTRLENSVDGNPVLDGESPHQQLHLRIPFPFTDKFMQKNQYPYEDRIEEYIIGQLNESSNINDTMKKIPYDTDLDITIKGRFAHLLLIDEKGLNLYSFSYDLFLSKCGATSHNIKQINKVFKKADIFKLNSMPLKNYKIIIQSLLLEGFKYLNIEDSDQEMPLFINVHPSLTFLPAAVIEDTMEDLRMSFEHLNVRYCTECKEIVAYDEYGYFAWFSASDKENAKDFFDYDFVNENLVTLGINEKAIFVAYPLAISAKSLESDKLRTHNFCNKNATFVQNAYYERGLEQFTDDIIVYFIKNEFKKRELTSTDNIIYFPCFPENYWELMTNIEVYGSGNFEECKKLIEEYVRVKGEEKINSEFGFNYSPTWPMENVDMRTVNTAKIVLESDIIKQMLTEGMDIKEDKKSSEIITPKEIDKEIEKVCKSMFASSKSQTFSNSVKSLSRCIHLLYSRQLLKKMKINDDTDVILRLKNQEWIKGLVFENLLNFHHKEKEWFYQSQQRSLENFFFSIQQRAERDRNRVLNVSILLIFTLLLTFALGFIIRYRGKDAEVIENLIKKR